MQTGLLGRRLDRLRHEPTRIVVERRPRIDHALELARELGGSSWRGVAIFESSHSVTIDRQALSDLPYGVPVDRPLVCFDLETTGLATAAGTLAFLVGLGSWLGNVLTVRQLVLSDHADETALL